MPGHVLLGEALAVAVEEAQQHRAVSVPAGDRAECLAKLMGVVADHRNALLVRGRADEFGDCALVHRMLVVDDRRSSVEDVAGCIGEE